MIPLAACSIVALAVILERLWAWRGLGRSADPEIVLARAAGGQWDDACQLGERSTNPVARVLAAGIRHRNPAATLAMAEAARLKRFTARTPNLLDAPAPSRETAPHVDSTLVPSTILPTPGGDLLVGPGTSGSAGSGANGPRGQGMAPSGGIGSQVAASGTGLTSLATPLGGYQVKPTYPAAARRDGAQGVATLRFEVLTTGRVGQVMVKQSAGHRELDRDAGRRP